MEQKLIINSYIWPQNLFEDSTQFRSKLLGNVKLIVFSETGEGRVGFKM